MSSTENEAQIAEEMIDFEIIEDNEQDGQPEALSVGHSCKVMLKASKGKKKGLEVMHFQCKYCPKNFQGPSNGTLLKHLRSKHPKKCPDLLSPAKSTLAPLRGFFDKKEMNKPFEPDVFMGKLLVWLIKTDQSFSTVDNRYFEDLLEYLKKDVTIHSRRTLMRRMEELHLQKKDELKEKLQQLKSKYSITCDIWTSMNQLSFFNFTIHYIDEQWTMQEGVIAFKFLEEEHDGERLARAMIEVLEDFGITERLLGVTADNASNNSTMMQHLERYYTKEHPSAGFSVVWNQIECMSHVINLGAQQILKEFKQPYDKDTYDVGSDSNDKMVTALSRLSFLVRKIRKSPKLRRLMKKVCEEKGVKDLIPIIDVRTRWNSTFDMLERAVKLKDVISDTIYAFRDNSMIALLLDAEDWTCMTELIDILVPLKEVTLITSLSSDSFSISHVLPLYNICIEHLQESMKKYKNTDDIYIGMEAGVNKLIHYYDNISPMVGIGLILNPTMKQDYLKEKLGWEDDWVESVKNNFQSAFAFYKKKLSALQNSSSTQEDRETEKKDADVIYKNLLKRKRSSTQGPAANTEEEYVRYFNAPLAEPGSNVLAFWKANEYNYPVLSMMAKDYLTIQASSVPSERAFSSGTDLVTPNRCSLGGKTIEMAQFLKFNL